MGLISFFVLMAMPDATKWVCLKIGYVYCIPNIIKYIYPSLWQSGQPHGQSSIDNVVNHAKKYDTIPKSSPFFSRMRSEGFPFIVWGSGGWTLVRRQLVVATFSRHLRVVNSVSMGKAAKPRLFWCADVAVSMGEAAEPRSGTLCKLCSTK